MLIGDEFPGARHREDPLWTRSSNQKWWGTTSSPSIYLIRATSPLKLLLNISLQNLSPFLYLSGVLTSYFDGISVASVCLVRLSLLRFCFLQSSCSRLPAKMSTSIINVQRDSKWRTSLPNILGVFLNGRSANRVIL